MSGDNSIPISPHLISSWHFCLLRFNLQFKKVIISIFFCSKSSLLHGCFETFYSPCYSLQKHFKTWREGLELSQTFTEFFFFVLQASSSQFTHTTNVCQYRINKQQWIVFPSSPLWARLNCTLYLTDQQDNMWKWATISFYMKQTNAKPTENSCNISLAAEERISQITFDLGCAVLNDKPTSPFWLISILILDENEATNGQQNILLPWVKVHRPDASIEINSVLKDSNINLTLRFLVNSCNNCPNIRKFD